MIVIVIVLVSFVFMAIYISFRKRIIKTNLDENRTILITGGCMGIGKEMVQILLKKNCRVLVLDIRDDLSKQIINQGAIFFKCDLSNLQEIKNIIPRILEKHPQIDILINNAGVAKLKLFNEESMDDVRLTNQVNYLAPVQLIKLLLPHMEQNGNGHIVNIGSVLSIIPGIKVPAYVASKHALFGFHNCLRVELKCMKSKIKTTFIAPWAINTGMFLGCKSKLEFLIPMMKEDYVAQQILKAIEYGEEVVSIRRPYLYLCHLLRILPCWVLDWITIYAQKDYLNQMIGRN